MESDRKGVSCIFSLTSWFAPSEPERGAEREVETADHHPLALSLALGAFAVPAFADGPAAGCGQGFSLGTLEEVWGSFEEIVQGQVARDDLVPYDLNDDLYMCFRQFKSNGGQDKQKSKLFGEDISGYNIVLFIDNKAVGQMK